MGRYKWLVPSWPSASVGITQNPHFLSNLCNWEVLYVLLGNRRALHGRYVFAFFHVETISPIKTNLEKGNKLVWCSVMWVGGGCIQFPIRFICFWETTLKKNVVLPDPGSIYRHWKFPNLSIHSTRFLGPSTTSGWPPAASSRFRLSWSHLRPESGKKI